MGIRSSIASLWRNATPSPTHNTARYVLLSRYPEGKAASISWLEDRDRLNLMKDLLLPQLEHTIVDREFIIIEPNQRVNLQGTIDKAKGHDWASADSISWPSEEAASYIP